MSDHILNIQSVVGKNVEDPNTIDFKVRCCPSSADGEVDLNSPVAKLDGFIADFGYYPTARDWHAHETFDMRSGHANHAFVVLTKRRSMIKRALPNLDMEMTGTFLHLEHLDVNQEYRGHGLGLRLLREARQMFARFGTLAILKAHPDGENVSAKECLRLADYYLSNADLGFTPISPRAEPGWLVADWSDTGRLGSDEAFWIARPCTRRTQF